MIHANGRELLRLAQPELARLIATVLDAPDPLEGGAFALFGMRDTAASTVFTLAELIAPEVGEIGWGDGNVRINHPYLRRVAKLAQSGQLAVGFIHSHPRGLPPRPSKVDEEMDAYLADYLGSLLTGRPFVSLILSYDGSRSEEHTSELQSLMRI